jgi:hypothetical protein
MNIAKVGWLLLPAMLLNFVPSTLAADWAKAIRKIVLLAGPLDSHPKDTHEYEKNVILLKHCLDTSPNLKGVRTEIHFGGWPQDPSTLDDADTIVMTSGGSDRRETESGDRSPALRGRPPTAAGKTNAARLRAGSISLEHF